MEIVFFSEGRPAASLGRFLLYPWSGLRPCVALGLPVSISLRPCVALVHQSPAYVPKTVNTSKTVCIMNAFLYRQDKKYNFKSTFKINDDSNMTMSRVP